MSTRHSVQGSTGTTRIHGDDALVAGPAAQEPDELLRTLFEAAPGFITSVDREGRILFVNRLGDGLSAEDVIGQSVFSFVAPEHAEFFRAQIEEVFTAGEPLTFDSLTRVADRTRWFRNRAAPLRQHGHVVSVIIDSIDITELKAAESEIRQHEQSLEDAQRIARLGTWSWEPGPDRFEWGGELVDVLGPTSMAASSRSFFDRVHPKDREQVEQTLDTALTTGKSFEFEHRIVLRDGSVRWLHVVGRSEASEEGPRLLGTAQDVTAWKQSEGANREAYRRAMELESLRSLNDLKTRLLDNLVEETTRRKKAEIQLREANEKLLDLVRFKAELLNVLSHELGNPLTPIKLQVHYLQSIVGDDSGAKKSIEIVDRNVERVINLSKDMLDVARLDAGRLRVERKPLDLAMTVREVLESFTETARRGGITLTADIQGPLPVEADARRLEQVLLNLTSNAIKYTPGPGTVRIRATTHEGHARVEIIDSGLGFTKEQALKLFRPFSRLHEHTRGAGAGTGLGLYISLGIIQQHEGTLTAVSDGPGKGSRFMFEIPLLRRTVEG
jgi:PAS domain S-box-containing protein